MESADSGIMVATLVCADLAERRIAFVSELRVQCRQCDLANLERGWIHAILFHQRLQQ